MGEKTIPTPRGERGELGGLGIELMNEENLDILRRNRAQGHVVLHGRT
jgi:hypothetical protein